MNRHLNRHTNRARIEFNPYLLIITILITYTVFVSSLATKIDTQHATIGEKHASIAQTYDEATTLAFTLHEHALAAAQRATSDLNSAGGISEPQCGQTGAFIHWNGPNSTCAPSSVHDQYYHLLDTHLRTELAALDERTGHPFSTITYEYYADPTRIAAIPHTPLPLPITTPNNPIDIEAFGITFARIESGVRAHTGWYYWRPTIELTQPTGLADYDLLTAFYHATLEQCPFLTPTDTRACLTHQAEILGLDAQVSPGENNYYFITAPPGTHLTTTPIRIAIHIPAGTPTGTTEVTA